MTEEDFDSVLRVHLKGTFAATKFACIRWRERSKAGDDVRAAVVNTVSSAGLQGNVGQANYGSAKAGIAALTIITSLEGSRYGVRANAVAPGRGDPPHRRRPQGRRAQGARRVRRRRVQPPQPAELGADGGLAGFRPGARTSPARSSAPWGPTSPTTSPGAWAAPSTTPRARRSGTRPTSGPRSTPRSSTRATRASRWAAAEPKPPAQPEPDHRRNKESRRTMANRRVAIVGASPSDCGRVDDKTAFELHHQGTTRALADAGIDKSEVDGFMSHGTGALPAHRAGRVPGPAARNWIDSTGHGGSVWEFMARARGGGHRPGPGRDRRPLLRLDPAGRPQEEAAHGQPLLRDTGARSSSTPPSATRSARSYAMVGPAPHARVRHHHRAAGRDRRLRPLQRRASTPTPTTGTPSPSRTSSRSPMIAGPAHQAALLHPLRRRRGHRAHPRGAGPGLRQGARSGCSAPARPSRTRP